MGLVREPTIWSTSRLQCPTTASSIVPGSCCLGDRIQVPFSVPQESCWKSGDHAEISPLVPLCREFHPAWVHPPRFSINHRLSDWPECWLELHCPSGSGRSVDYAVRLLMQHQGDATFERALRALRCKCCNKPPAPVSGDSVNPSAGYIRNPATLRSRERRVDGSIGRFSAWQGWAETGDEDAGRGGGDAAASWPGLGFAQDRGCHRVQPGDGAALPGRGGLAAVLVISRERGEVAPAERDQLGIGVAGGQVGSTRRSASCNHRGRGAGEACAPY